MYLNTFKKDKVLEVFDKAMAEKADLFFCENLSDMTRQQANDIDYIKLSYDDQLHRIFLHKFDPQEPLFCNPSYEAKICPEDIFLSNIYPSNDYKRLMTSK